MATLRVRHNCPACGAPVSLDEADRFLSCGYCKVRLYMHIPGLPRYILPTSVAPDAETVFIPYLRMRGMYFAIRDSGVEGKVLDSSLRASQKQIDFMPDTLGVRPQALELHPAVNAPDSSFLPLAIESKDLLKKAMEGAQLSDACGSPDEVRYRAFIGETTSVIYYPVKVAGSAIHDQLADRPMAQLTHERREPLSARDPHTDWNIRFIAAKCPHCGWDLDARGKAAVLICRHCTAVWRVAGDKFGAVRFHIISDTGAPACHIPFWRLSVVLSGAIEARTYGDLIRLANLPLVPTPELDKTPLTFWVPAFKCPPALFLRLSRQLTGARPRPELMISGALPPEGGVIYDPTLGAEDAAEAVELVLSTMMTKRRDTYARLAATQVDVVAHEFVYMPFKAQAADYVHNLLGFAIPKNALTYQ